MQVETRELRNRLSHYLRQVRESKESIYVTDRGEIVAELRPVADGMRKARSCSRSPRRANSRPATVAGSGIRPQRASDHRLQHDFTLSTLGIIEIRGVR